jgi:hypothetical protein
MRGVEGALLAQQVQAGVVHHDLHAGATGLGEIGLGHVQRLLHALGLRTVQMNQHSRRLRCEKAAQPGKSFAPFLAGAMPLPADQHADRQGQPGRQRAAPQRARRPGAAAGGRACAVGVATSSLAERSAHRRWPSSASSAAAARISSLSWAPSWLSTKAFSCSSENFVCRSFHAPQARLLPRPPRAGRAALRARGTAGSSPCRSESPGPRRLPHK